MNDAGNPAWAQRDLQHLWHPCTQMKDHEHYPPVPVRRGQGVWLEDFEGHRFIDAISSWCVNLFGHAHPQINAAVREQLETLEHVILAGFTHAPAVELAEQLARITPADLNRCFFADNGSSAIEVALKMSFHYWLNSGKPKKQRFITLENSYHGETLGALAVGNVELYKDTYGPLLMPTLAAPSPDCWHRAEGESCEAFALRRLADMETLLERHHEEVAAVIVEPLVQCAGNMRMYHPAYLTGLRQLCDRYQVHLIADEIAVGFGRTGSLFACEQAGISPDFLCLSKGLTGGYLPLSAVLTTDTIYEAFYDDYTRLTAFLHSHSYTGNPLACRAALATLKLFEEQPVLENNRKLAGHMARLAAPLGEHPHVAEVRQHGMILAVELVADKARRQHHDWRERRGLRIHRKALELGVLLRPLGPVAYVMPPYVITPEELEQVFAALTAGIAAYLE